MGGCSVLFSPKRLDKDVRPTFGSRTTAMEISEHVDLKGKTALVTGGNAGIGKETVRALYNSGCEVILCCRNVTSGEQVAKEMTFSPHGNRVHVYELNLSDLCSVDACIAKVKEDFVSLDILILNAGCISRTLARTAQGFEEGFGVNFASQYYLTSHLLDMMTNPGCRIVGLSSTAHWMGKIFLDDLNFETRAFSGWTSYGQSKLAMLLFMKYLALKFERESIDNIKVFSVHPGAIRTQLVQGTRYASRAFALFRFFCKTPEQGAACTMYAATLCEEKNGSYLENCHLGLMARRGNDLDMAEKLIQATDAELEKRHDSCHKTVDTVTEVVAHVQPEMIDQSSIEIAQQQQQQDMKQVPRKGTISLQVQIA